MVERMKVDGMDIFQLDDPTRRDKLLSINFRLMEEALKFLSGLKENQRMDSNWNAVVSSLFDSQKNGIT